MHPGVFAAKEPARPAVIMGVAGPAVTYAELEARSNPRRPRGAGCAAFNERGVLPNRFIRAPRSLNFAGACGRGGGYWRAMCMRSSASVSSISLPLTSTVTLWMVPVNLNGLA